MKYLINCYAIFFLTIVSVQAQTQKKTSEFFPTASFGEIENKVVTTSLLKDQVTMKLSAGYTFLRADVYFWGAGFSYLAFTHIDGPELKSLSSFIDSCKNGSSIAFENIAIKSSSGSIMKIQMPIIKVGQIFSSFDFGKPDIWVSSLKQTRVAADIFKTVKEITVTQGYQFIRSDVYFAGAGFEKAAMIVLRELSLTSLKELLQQCKPGTVVSFTKTILKNSTGKLVPASDQFYALY